MFNPLNLLSKIIKSSNQRELDRVQKIETKINNLENNIIKLSDGDFPKKTEEFIKKINEGVSLNEILPEAFALVREASKRIINERHFDCQILGSVVIHEGKICEAKTGEGKQSDRKIGRAHV